MVNIFKANGHLTEFKKSKIEKTVIKAGGSRQFAKQIANKVFQKVHKGTRTKDILKLTLKLLKEQPGVALRYDLKRAIMSLGPHGFTFEEYFSQILQNYNYKTKVGFIMKGKATHHEVDILANHKNNERKEMIECKYHNRVGKHTDSKVAMYTYARYLDLKNNPKNKITHGWLATNTRCTPHAVEYAKGVGLKITTWNYASKGEKNLQKLIKAKGLYPITILPSVVGEIKEKLAKVKIVLAKDIILYDFKGLKKKTNLREKEVKQVLEEVKEVFCNPTC